MASAGGLQAELRSGTEVWQQQLSSAPLQAAPGAGTIGGGRSWACEKCGFKNMLGATRCTSCGWDRKAALKLRMRQDLMAKMASNGGIPGPPGTHMQAPNGLPNG